MQNFSRGSVEEAASTGWAHAFTSGNSDRVVERGEGVGERNIFESNGWEVGLKKRRSLC